MVYQVKGFLKTGKAKGRFRTLHSKGSNITFKTKKEAEGAKKILRQRISPTKRKKFGFKIIKVV